MKKYLVYVAIIVVLVGVFYQKVFIPKHTFDTVEATNGDITIKVNGVGNVDSENLYKISTIYGGKLTEFNLHLGDKVYKGDLIGVIDSVDLEDKIKELTTNILVLQTNIKSLEFDKESANTQYLYQEEVLRKNEKLFKQKAISELDYKKFKTDKEVAKFKVETIAKQIESLKKQIIQIQASISGLKKRLSRYKIYSQIDGIVTKKYVSNYDVLTPNQPLIEVVNPKDVWVKTPIDTRVSADVKLNDKAMIKLRSSKKFVDGYVVKINPINNAVTNEREIFVKFYNLKKPFYLNEQAIVNISVKTLKNVTTIPSKTVVFYNGSYGVWVIQNKHLHFVKVTILTNDSNKIAIKEKINNPIVIPDPKKAPLKEGMKTYND